MNRHDEQIRQALSAEESPVINDELPILEQIIESFRGRNRWLVAYIWIYTFVFAAFTAYSIYRFANAADVMDTVTWGVGILFFALMVALGKIWYWLELNKNIVARELKRLELQLAQLANEVRSSPR